MNYEKAREYAATASEMCFSILEKDDSNYWVRATQAEAFLLLGQIDEALDAYALAVELPSAKPSHIASTRKQALQICSFMKTRVSASESPMLSGHLGLSLTQVI